MKRRRILSCMVSVCIAYAPMSCYALKNISPPETEIGKESLVPVSDIGAGAEKYAFENADKYSPARHGGGVPGIVPENSSGTVFSCENGFFSQKGKTYTQADCFLSCISRRAP